eukprot:6123083-Amphidinium_carterae.2
MHDSRVGLKCQADSQDHNSCRRYRVGSLIRMDAIYGRDRMQVSCRSLCCNKDAHTNLTVAALSAGLHATMAVEWLWSA